MDGTVPPLEPGDPERIGDYRLLGRLGHGGMGRVYLGRDPAGQRVAVKIVHPELVADPTFRERFRREVAAASKVLSFFTVPLVDADAEADPPWLATQFVDGPSLAATVRAEGPLPPGRLCSLAAALGEALIVVHAAGIVHRDLKPSNVLLAEDGPRVIDFGIARAADSDDLTRAGGFVGTYGYAPPEQILGQGPVGPAGDVFSLGGVLLFAATGRSPFGDGPPPVLAYRTVHQDPDLTGVPEPLTGLVRSCLAKDPAARPTPQEVIAAARAAQSRLPPPSAHTRRDHAPTPPPLTPARTARPPAVRRSRRALAAVALATVPVVAVGLLLTDVLRGDAKDQGPRIAAAVKGGDPLPAVRADGDRRRVWTALPKDEEQDITFIGGWLTPNVLVRVDVSGVRGYKPATGGQLWVVPPPVQNMVPCNASSGRLATSGGVGVVGYGRPYSEPPACEEVAALDTATGRLLWHRGVGPPPNGLNVAAAPGDVLVASGEEGVLGLDRATGREVWKYRWLDGECRVTRVVPGPATIAMAQTCDPELGDTFSRLVVLDPATGRVSRRQDVPDEMSVELLSAEPLVFGYLERDGTRKWAAFRGPGAEPHDLPLPVAAGAATPESLTDGTTLVAELEVGRNDERELRAVDVPTGRLLWRHKIVDHVGFTLLRLGGGSLLTVENTLPDGEPGWRVVARRLSDGAVIAEGTLPASFVDLAPSAVLAGGGLVVQLDDGNEQGLVGYDVPR